MAGIAPPHRNHPVLAGYFVWGWAMAFSAVAGLPVDAMLMGTVVYGGSLDIVLAACC